MHRNSDPLFYVVMANYNGYKVTSETVQSLKRIKYSNYKIVVVDDCSKDDSYIKLKLENPDIQVLKTKRNSGLCTAFNVGIKEAILNGADYIFVVQNDTKNFSINYFGEMLKTFEDDDKLGIVGSLVYDYDGNFRWKGEAKMKFGYKLELSEGYVIRREVFENIGLFNERLAVYFEDLDFVIRARNFGYKTKALDSISFDHVGQATFSKQSFSPNYLRVRNIVFFIRRYCKQQSMNWKLKQYFSNTLQTLSKVKIYFKKFDFISMIKLVIAIVIGTFVGFFLPWSSENEKPFKKINLDDKP